MDERKTARSIHYGYCDFGYMSCNFGSNNFVVPSMAFMLLMFMSLRSKLEIRKECQ